MEQISVIAAGVCEQQNMDFDAQMKELCSLAEACGLCVAETFTQKLSSRNPASYFGAGRLLELKERLEELDVHDVILLHECTPAQLRTISSLLPIPSWSSTAANWENPARSRKHWTCSACSPAGRTRS